MLRTPAYIRRAAIATREVRYPWDEWDVRSHFMFEDEDQLARLNGLTNKANTALTIATAEWIQARFALLDNDARVGQYLEAAWAGVVHPAYCEYTDTVDDEWRGPVRAPLALAITIANDALFGLNDDPQVSHRACWMYNLARHVLPSSTDFEAWFEKCVIRLERLYTLDVDTQSDAAEEDLFADTTWQGTPVPRQAFDPDFDYQPPMAPALWDTFLRGLDPTQNPFLCPPDVLAGYGVLSSPPYQYAT